MTSGRGLLGYDRGGLASWSLTVRRDARIVLPPFIVSRLIVIVATIAGSRLIPAGAATAFPIHGPAALQPFLRFDATYYQSLWQSGYSGPLAEYHAAFYPLYPLLVRAIGTLAIGPETAALLISNGAFLAALFLIYRVAIPRLRGRDREGALLTPVVIGGLLSPLGLIAFCIILLIQTGNPFGFLHAQSLWLGPHPRNPLFPITSALRLFTRHNILDTEAPVFPVLVGFLAAIVWAARRLPLRYAAWGAGFLVVAVLQGYYVRSVTAAPRHILEWFPLFFAIAVLLRPPRPWFLTPLWLLASAVVLAAYAAMFGSWHYVS